MRLVIVRADAEPSPDEYKVLAYGETYLDAVKVASLHSFIDDSNGSVPLGGL
jgi:hypothetical protein